MFMAFDIIFDGFGHGFHINFSIVLIVQNPDALWVWASLVMAFGMFLSVSLAVPKGGRRGGKGGGSNSKGLSIDPIEYKHIDIISTGMPIVIEASTS